MTFDGPNVDPALAGAGGAPTDPDPAGAQVPAGPPASEAPTCYDRPTPPLAPPVAAPPPPLAALDKYELLEQLAQGGMGVIYKARDTRLDRVVALKKIRSGVWAHAEEVERFRTEARAIAQLHHPHIVPVYDVNECDGQHYFTMHFAPGGSVAQHLDRYRADPRLAARLMAKVARAVHCAHLRNILHRDLKPGNILLDDNGEPLVTDFGLAKFLDADTELTRSGVQVGTPAYMAPEQAAGRTAQVSARSDVWALGVILYELFTGEKPFQRSGAGDDDLTQVICSEDPPRPRVLKPALDRDLETIVLECLEKEPTDRYPTAEALAEDLERWLNGEAPAARRIRWPTRVGRRVRRHAGRAAVAALALAFLALVGESLVAFSALGRDLSPQEQARQERVAYLTAIQRDLAAGKPVTLVGRTGAEKPYPFQLSPSKGLVDPHAVGGLVLDSAQDRLMVPLVPDPGVSSYRLEAEVLKSDQTRGRFAGLFVGYSDQPTARGLERCYCQFGYADNPADKADRAMDRRTGPTLVTLRPNGQWEEGLPPKTHTFSGGSHNLSAPAPPGTGQLWRKLALEVRPGEIRAFWEGKPMEPLTAAGLARAATHLVRYEGFLPPPPFAFTARGGLGVYVEGTRAEFRNVVLKPLPPR